MKKLIVLVCSLVIASISMAQLVAKAKCPDFVVDVLDGNVNGIKANGSINEIKGKFPCFSSFVEESTNVKCGGGVFFLDRDISFYTQHDYIEIGEKFKGKLSIPLIGAKRGSLFNTLGRPKISDDTWEAYQTSYGCLVVHYTVAGAAGKIKYFQMSTVGTESLKLCENL